MKQVVGQFGSIWQGTSLAQRLLFIVVIMGFLFGFMMMAYWVRKPEHGLLYSDLGQKEASEIVAYLSDNNISYSLKNNGTTILVPSNMIYEIRMNLAKNSLPRGDVGFELFDKVKFGMSNLAQKVNYRRALQGELTKTISNLDGVEWARVQIVIPEPSLFIEDEKPSTASVILKTRNGRTLKPQQISGITHLVSASVEGLNPENVTIADSRGNLLSRAGDSTVSGVVTDQLDIKKNIEDYYASKALSIVEKITGLGKAIVRVSAELDFKHVDEKQIEYDSENKVPISQVITTQSTETPQMLESGDGSSQLKSSKEKEETETTQYALSKTERAVSEHVAGIKRLTVAVLVDGYYKEEETEDGKINRKFEKRSKEEIDQIAAIVKQAIGLDEKPPRNDTLEVQSVQFQGQIPVFIDEENIEKEDKKEFILAIAKNSSLAIAVLAFLLVALKFSKKLTGFQPKYATYSPTELTDGYDAYDDEEDEEDEEEERKDAKMNARRNRANEKRVKIRDNIIKQTKEDPRATGQLVKKWLREGD